MRADHKRQMAAASAVGMLKAFAEHMQLGLKLNMELHLDRMLEIIDTYDSAKAELEKEFSARDAS